MRRSAVYILVLVAFVHIVKAQNTTTRHLDAKAISEALQDFLTETRTQLQADAVIWRERAQKVRQDIRDRFNINSNEDEATRRRGLLTDNLLNAKLDKLQATWQLLRDVGGAVWDVVDTKFVKVKDFFSDVLGADYAQYLPHNWLGEGFTWDNLGAFDLHSNIGDFIDLSTLQDITRPQSLSELYDAAEAAKDHFCVSDRYLPPTKVPTHCVGPKVLLELVPKSCVFDSKNKQVICDPAKIVLRKIPGYCVLKHYTAAAWKGKECKLAGTCGFSKVATLGGRNFTVSLGEFDHDSFDLHNFDIHNLFGHHDTTT